MYCRIDGPCLAPWVGCFFDDVARTLYQALFNCRFLSDGCMHLPQVQYTMPTSQYKEQPGHCILEEISHSSKYSVLPMLVINSFDFSLNGLNSSVLFKSSINKSRFGCVSNCRVSFFYDFLANTVLFLDC